MNHVRGIGVERVREWSQTLDAGAVLVEDKTLRCAACAECVGKLVKSEFY